MRKKYDWNALKTEFVTSDISAAALSKKHGIHPATLYRHYQIERWQEARQEYLGSVMEKCADKAAYIAAIKLSKELDMALESVGCLELKKRKLGELSGGELQRVMLVNALYPLPELLILDEPVSGVDASGSEQFYKAIMNLKQNYHMAIAMVSHDLGIVREFADNVVLINKTVLKSGSAQEVFESPEFGQAFFSVPERCGEK